MTVRMHRGELADLSRYTESVAIDTETMGLHPHRDRLCVVQLSNGDGSADVVQIPKDHGKHQNDAPNLSCWDGRLRFATQGGQAGDQGKNPSERTRRHACE